MKTIFYYLFIATFFLISCSNDLDNNSDNNMSDNEDELVKSFEELSTELEQFTCDFFEENQISNIQTRANVAWWTLLAVMDYEGGKYGGRAGAFFGGVHGAVSGALAGGVFLSACYALASNSSNMYPTNLLNKNNLSMASEVYIKNISNEYDFVGEAHNKVLEQLLSSPSKYMRNGKPDEDLLFNDVLTLIKPYNISAQDLTLLKNNKESFINIYKQSEIAKTTTYSEAVVNATFDKMIKDFPENKADINISRNYILNAVKITDLETLKKYSAEYENIIFNSNISEISKAELGSSISIGKNSQAFWNTNSSLISK